jgi:large subunit ribosomal protein L18
MSKTSTFQPKFRRRREGKTNYAKRVALLKAGKARLVVRRSSRHVIAQFVAYKQDGDETIASAHSKNLSGFGWRMATTSISAAYLVGLLAGLRAKAKNTKEAVLDIGLATPVLGSVPFAVLKGALDAGIAISFEQAALPSDDRIKGKHIEEFAKRLSPEELKKKFGACIANGADPKRFVEHFEAVKKAVIEKGIVLPSKQSGKAKPKNK